MKSLAAHFFARAGRWALSASLFFSVSVLSAQVVSSPESAAPVFSQFVYQGNDSVYSKNPLAGDEFYNPILQG